MCLADTRNPRVSSVPSSSAVVQLEHLRVFLFDPNTAMKTGTQHVGGHQLQRWWCDGHG